MGDLENHLAGLGDRGAESDPVCWRVARIGGSTPTRQAPRGSRARRIGRGRDLYMWILRSTETPAGPYRVTRAG